MRRTLPRLAATVLLAGCASRVPPNADNPLPKLTQAKYVLLGEVHDNAEQHRRRARLMSELLAGDGSGSVVFEQMDRGRDADIAGARQDADAVADAGHLNRPGWMWPLHRPLIESALNAHAEIRGGDLSDADARRIVHGGETDIPDPLRALLATSHWQAADEAKAEHEIDIGHCGALPAALLPAMALAQRARDAALADAMLQAGLTHDRVILIAGNGHVRTDLGVPRYLRGAGVPATQIVSVGYLEQADPASAFDLTQVTPAPERADPCEAFRAR